LTADAVVHVLGVGLALVGIGFLVAQTDTLQSIQTASVWVYSVCLVTVFTTSAAYSFWPSVSGKLILRRVDQSAIFLFIAASYTPLISQAQGEPSRAVLASIWGMAWVGVILKIGYPGRFERISIILCLLLGWSGLFVYDEVFGSLPLSAVLLVLAGGVLYSIGVLFHVCDSLRFQNAIWHAFVVAAAALQFLAILYSTSIAAARSW